MLTQPFPLGGTNAVGRGLPSPDDAEERGMKLLKDWLSPVQLNQLETQGAFEVKGCHTGKHYRIRIGRQQNVFELDKDGNHVCGWCFGPQGHLVPGDVMLAQKIALETNERAALGVANVFSDSRGLFSGWFIPTPREILNRWGIT